jgi:alkylation response protein AidB-like acyl-CoA dehydrogenase
MGRAALEIAANYSNRRRAFNQNIRQFEGVNFKIADSQTLLDASRALNYAVGKSIKGNEFSGRTRRLVSEAKKFSTDSAWTVVNHAMQVLGGIGYTNIFPVERLLRDIRLITIWTGTNEIMNLVIQHEYFREFLSQPSKSRDVESDSRGVDYPEEKEYNEE